jgi:DNA-binding NtrC family response regulator
VDYFTEQICQEQGIALKRFNDSAMAVLKAQPWCGNIRELRNVVERLIILGDHEISGEMVKLYI